MISSDDELDRLYLIGYEKVANHGFTLPCYSQTEMANAYYVARAKTWGRSATTIDAFEIYHPNALIELPREKHRIAKIRDLWLDVFLWNDIEFIGTAQELWKSLSSFHDEMKERAPLTMLKLAEQIPHIKTDGYARDAFHWLRRHHGDEMANEWRIDSYLRGIVIRNLRRRIGETGDSNLIRQLMRDIDLRERGTELTLHAPEQFSGLLDIWQVALDDVQTAASAFGLALTSVQLVDSKETSLFSPTSSPIVPQFILPSRPFDPDQAKAMILAGEAPPVSWQAAITELDFSGTKLLHLQPLADLTELRSLNLRNTQVSDLSPLDGLAGLRTLDLQNAMVSDLSALSSLTLLQRLVLRGTSVHNLGPLSALTALQSLNLRGTPISDLTPLSDLINLRGLVLTDTQVSDVGALAPLTELRRLILRRTFVSNLRPLSSMVNLILLDLASTPLYDVTSLATLTRLQRLVLEHTKVEDVSSLVALINLRRLNLRYTMVQDLSVLEPLRECVIFADLESMPANETRNQGP